MKDRDYIINIWVHLRKTNNTIPSDVLDNFRDMALYQIGKPTYQELEKRLKLAIGELEMLHRDTNFLRTMLILDEITSEK